MEISRIIVQDEEGFYRLLEAKEGVYDNVLSKTKATDKKNAKEIFEGKGYNVEGFLK